MMGGGEGVRGMRAARRDEADTALVVAAQGGDERARDELIAAYLPLLYNVVGRSLSGHADVDDVVQETMIRMVRGLPGLREPDRFRSWLIAIAVREVRDAVAARQVTAGRSGPLDDAGDTADPGADFADLTILRLGLTGERRRVAEATRWLDQDDRELLSLWWLEAAGEIERAELAAAIGVSTAHAAVRVQRMRAQLDAARAVVTAVGARPRCPDLDAELTDWDGVPSGRWRKRIARHTRDCVHCNPNWSGLIPAERLLAGMALVPLPGGAAALLTGSAAGSAAAAGAAGSAAGAAAGSTAAAGAGASAGIAVAGGAGQSVLVKAVVSVVAAAAVAGGGYAAVQQTRDEPPQPRSAPSAPPAATASSPAPTTPATPTPPPTTNAVAVYGSVVDAVDGAPPRNRKPATLPRRPEGTLRIAASGDNDPRPEVVSLVHRGEWVTLSGRGYVRISWQVPYWVRAGGIVPPAWSGLDGRLFHVASGGGHRMDDRVDGTTFMGGSALPEGVQQFWSREFYYLDGEVTFHQRESGGDYNVYVHLVDRRTVIDDVTAPPADGGPLRYGLVRDPGTDACPIPQFLTRATDPAEARRDSRV
jgi:RNA polymerase sigma factor (sigma-70 family)